jgi:DNA-binding CsgD family transcriptional regulator
LIEEKNRSLASHTLHIIRKNTMLEALKSDLQKITQDNVRDKVKAVRQLIRDIDLNFQQDKDWDDFRQVFENVHQHFFIFLQEKYPELSAGDLRLCALIKINLDNRQIASVLGISADSLRVARHRLKKKLGLGQAESLSSFIQSV